MVELCFSQSAQGALRAAQHCGGKKKTGHSGLVFFYKKGEKPSRREIRRYRKQLEREEAERERRAVPLGNDPSDVLGLRPAPRRVCPGGAGRQGDPGAPAPVVGAV